ncbi:MAG: uroporphyrinogen decarboxylase family protein [Planctomycetaceae bacterium]|jgi:MtaA/CmuA family methyltransferase|nr:uroporphyrinogen decarboxylase family protein [Planctomycetaceae bacterium]
MILPKRLPTKRFSPTLNDEQKEHPMNGYERILATLEKRPTDCLAFMPITMMFAADQTGIPYGQYTADYRLLVEAQLETARKFDIDHVSCISDPAREAADCGGTIHYFEDQPPAVDESNAFLTDKTLLKTLSVPDPFREGSRMNDRVQAVRLFAEKVKGERFIEGWVEGPCAEAADLRGINNLMTDFIDDPQFVQELFGFNIRMATVFAQAQIDAGCDIIGIGDAAASLVGPRLYKNVVFPFEKLLVDKIHALGCRVRLHICGNTNRSLTDIGQLGCDLVDLDSMVSIEKARKETGENQVLDGNLDPVKVLRNGTPQQIQEVLAECFCQAGTNYIVGAGCEVPRDTPHENFQAMHDFARQNKK